MVVSGDGSLLMSLGSLVTVVGAGATNLSIVLLDNGIYEVTGGQKTPATSDSGLLWPGASRGNSQRSLISISSSHGRPVPRTRFASLARGSSGWQCSPRRRIICGFPRRPWRTSSMGLRRMRPRVRPFRKSRASASRGLSQPVGLVAIVVNCSLAGSHCSLRPRRRAITPRWQTLTERWPISASQIGCSRERTQSKKFRMWLSLA